MITLKSKSVASAILYLSMLAISLAAFVPRTQAQERAHAAKTDSQEDERWAVVAPGRVEPALGKIKIVAPVVGVVGEVLVKANDKVLAGEPLIRLTDDEAQARLAAAQMQVLMRKRVRNDESASTKAAARRKAEDAVADAAQVASEARSSFDKAAVARRGGGSSDVDVEAARSAMMRAQDRLKQLKVELRRIEAESPLPTQAEGQLNIARSELLAIEAAIEKMTIRAPITGTVLQMNAKVGELATPSATQPLLVLADVSALRVRAEVDERDIEEVKVGQPVAVRPVAFRDREFSGTVSFVARLVESGRDNVRSQHNVTDVGMTDIGAVEVLVDLTEPGPLSAGMKADVYFYRDSASRE